MAEFYSCSPVYCCWVVTDLLVGEGGREWVEERLGYC